MIEARAVRMKKKAYRELQKHQLPLDFTKLVAERRANRVAEYKQIAGNHDHQYDIQKAVELENQFNEKQRMTDVLRLGGLPASLAHPIARAMMS